MLMVDGPDASTQGKGCFTPPLDVVARWLAHRSFYPTKDDGKNDAVCFLLHAPDDVVRL